MTRKDICFYVIYAVVTISHLKSNIQYPNILYEYSCIFTNRPLQGSGKTLAFGIPILQQILDLQMKMQNIDAAAQPNELKALILSPTRELAKQIVEHLTKVAKYTSIKIMTVVGGVSPYKQQRLLSKRPDILVGTPGRMWETLNQYENSLKDLAPKGVRFIVLDEADRMVEFGHYPEVESILDAVQLKIEDDETFVFEPSRENSRKENAKERKAKFQAKFEQDNNEDDDDEESELDDEDNNENMEIMNENENEFEEIDDDDEMSDAEGEMVDEDIEDDENVVDYDNGDEYDENEDEEMPVLEDFEEDHTTSNNANIVRKNEVKHKRKYNNMTQN